MLAAAAVCPHPPMLVPELASGAAAELDDCRAACRRVVDRLVGTIFVVGANVGLSATSFAPWGVDVPVDVPEALPLPLLVGAWLTDGRLRSFVVVEPELDADECGDLGRELAASAEQVSLLVMGDGSARRSEKAPGYLDPRAEAFDAEMGRIMNAGDLQALANLDRSLAAELLVAGAAPWQVLAGAAASQAAPKVEFTDPVVPYGVSYLVAGYRWS